MKQEKRPRDYWNEIVDEAIKNGTANDLLQPRIDSVVRATLERSGLIEPARPLREQRRNLRRERELDLLFIATGADSEEWY